MNPLRATPNPHLLEIPVRPWLRRFAAPGGSPSLERVPDAELDGIRERGFHGVWLMGVWRTGERARRLARVHPGLRVEYSRLLPGWTDEDVQGSPYSISGYEPGPELGGREGLARFRTRLHARGLGLMLDLVPNHLGIDHPWIEQHPERFVTGTQADRARAPDGWFERLGADGRRRFFAHGRDPYFPPWTDTVQLDYRLPVTRRAMEELLVELAGQCDGLRCDMAMLVLEDVFATTWGERTGAETGDFWTQAVGKLRERGLDTVLLAEAYWDLEPRLIEAGFDFAYDKRLYDAVVAGDAEAVRRCLAEPPERLAHGAHFLENHDEPRALAAFGPERLRAAAAIALPLPGLRLFHEGQEDGRRIRLPVQLVRAPEEAPVEWCRDFHARLQRILGDAAFHRGCWSAPEVRPAGPGEPVPPLAGSVWRLDRELRAVLANLSGSPAYARVPLPVRDGAEDLLLLTEEMTGERFERSHRETRQDGLFVKLAPWGVHFLKADDGAA